MKLIDPTTGRPNRIYNFIRVHTYFVNYGLDFGSFSLGSIVYDQTDKRYKGKILWHISFRFLIFSLGVQKVA